MHIRPKPFFVIAVLVLLSLALVACERERPPATVAPAATTAPRGTVAPSPTPPAAATQVTLPGVTGAQTTPATVVGATPTAPAPQPVVVNPEGQGGASGGASFTYTVQAGDTLAAIAARYDVTQAAIVQLNALADPDALTVGQQLKIPGAAPATDTGTSTTTGSTAIYVVQSGDTLAAIARRFGTTTAELVRLNGLADPDRLSIGQQLKVPSSGSGTEPATGGASGQQQTHVVAAGETLLKIAQRYGVTVKAIQDANNLPDPDRIYVGQKLVIP